MQKGVKCHDCRRRLRDKDVKFIVFTGASPHVICWDCSNRRKELIRSNPQFHKLLAFGFPRKYYPKLSDRQIDRICRRFPCLRDVMERMKAKGGKK